MPFDCPVCGKYAPGGRRFCSKPCSKKVKRMCRRIGCTETWYATENHKKRYCSRGCTPQSSPGPIYPYKLNRSCHVCHERFTLEVKGEEQRTKENTCNECKAVLGSIEWRSVYLIKELGLRLAVVKRINSDTVNWLYENGLPKKKQPKKKQTKKKQIEKYKITDLGDLSERDLLETIWFSGTTE